jgi:phage shock protein A
MREIYAGPKVDEAFSRFEMLERRVDWAEGRAEAAGMGAAPRSLEDEIAELRTSERVEAELAALKAKHLGKEG